MDIQVVFQTVFTDSPDSHLWTSPFVIPAYVALCLIVVQGLVIVLSLKNTRSPTDPSQRPGSPTRSLAAQGFFDEVKQHIKSQGGTTVLMNLLRLFGTLTLVGLTTAALLLLQEEQDLDILGKWGSHNHKKHRERSGRIFTRREWIEVIHLAFYSYASFLALLTLVSRKRWRSVAGIHLTLAMLAMMALYAYRDLYPLGTFVLAPQDANQGWLLWSRVGGVFFVAVVIPLISPRIYHPVDPKNPSQEINPEQTASLLSFLTFSFLDPVIWMAARTPHLEYESLPPLADYDAASHLVAKSEKILDPFFHKKRTHIFWGLMNLFAWDYIRLALMILLMVLASLMAPVGLNRLLSYLENKGEGAVVRPWVWILWLFLGPVASSTAMQYHNFLSTRMSVRTEGILTQLIFDHALRIRMTGHVDPIGDTSTGGANTPETRSVVEPENNDNEEETVHDSGVSVVSSANTAALKSPATYPGPIPSTVNSEQATKSQPTPKTANIIGRINNHVTTDLASITAGGRDFLFLVLLGPLQIIVCICFLYTIIGWSALVGLLAMIVTAPLPSYIAKMTNEIQSERMKKTDARVQSVVEILSVIRMTKLFGWEQKADNMIAEKREVELQWLKRHQLLKLGNSLLNFFIPLLTMLATFASYTIIQNQDLSVAIVFSSMAVFEMLREALLGTFFVLPMMIDARVSLERINDFLLNTELLDRFAQRDTESGEDIDPSQNIDRQVIGFRNTTFSWEKSQQGKDTDSLRRQFRLSIEGELFFQNKKLNLIIGPTGSGKTSMLMALLGEMCYEPNGERAGFNLPRGDGVAYVAQETWVQNETIKDNILFGKPYEKERYDKVIYQCCLERDLSLFDVGDATEVGEKGLTLSGGQKARVTLARAVYSDAEILLLDDILASLDIHTARFIVDNCLKGDLLESRTIILVTHNVAMVASIADFFVSLNLDGRVASQGSVSTALKDSALRHEVEKMSESMQKDGGSENKSDPEGPSGKLVVPEEIALGHVAWSALTLYTSSMGNGFFWLTAFGGMLFAELGLSLAAWFLGHWASQYDEHPGMPVSASYYLSIYSLLLISIMALYAVGLGLIVLGSIKASRTMHRKLVASILGTTFRWLDIVPTARIVARCTQDIFAVDGPVNQHFSDLTSITIVLLVQFGSVILFVPTFVLPGMGVFIAGGLCGQLYMKAQLSIKREMSNRRSPVLANFGAAISGLASIRAYGAQEMCREESLRRIDGYTRPARTSWNCNRWVSFRGNAIGGIFAAVLATYLVYGNDLHTASNTGFLLTMAVGFSTMIVWWVRILNEFEVESNSLERIESYVNIEQETKATEVGKPPAYWPASGAIAVENLCARYSIDGPQVLHNLSFKIGSGERVGIVGRTGSGKSSLTLSLLRCIPTEGRVILDGLPTDNVNLDALRSNITIIPQQPELLSGTLRENLDPFSEYSDATLNDTLRAAGLFRLQDEKDSSRITLDSSVSSGGSNLSMGQRQILALARAIVRQSKLLILDEATSAIDYATDAIIQNTLREVLKGATLLIVAHRLQSIMDADKIMVLDAGKMVEFDSPINLLRRNNGYFRSLVNESGDRDSLWRLAQKSDEKMRNGGEP